MKQSLIENLLWPFRAISAWLRKATYHKLYLWRPETCVMRAIRLGPGVLHAGVKMTGSKYQY